MKQTIQIAVAISLMLIVSVANSQAQNLVQSLSVSLTAYDTVGNRTIRIGTQQLIRYFVGTNVPNGHLYLVTPSGNTPGAIGNLNAFLRITSGSATIYEIPSPDQFNVYQDFAVLRTSGLTISSHALNRFSIDSGSVRAELQGLSNWNISQRTVSGLNMGGAGSIYAKVNGWISIYNVTDSAVPVGGLIVAGRPRPER